MNAQNWIDWAQKQLADLSMRLFRQGYQPARIEFLNQTNVEFSEQFGYHLACLNEAMDHMGVNPDGYHHFEDFSRAKAALLEFTNRNRERFLELDLRRTA